MALLFSCNGPSFKSSVQTYRDPKTVGLSPGCGYEEASELMSLTQDLGTSLELIFYSALFPDGITFPIISICFQYFARVNTSF